VKHKIALYFSSFILFGFLFVAADATAQTIAYRQTNLSSNLPNVANNVTPDLVNPWGIAFLCHRSRRQWLKRRARWFHSPECDRDWIRHSYRNCCRPEFILWRPIASQTFHSGHR
jgi:hypothetical protein